MSHSVDVNMLPQASDQSNPRYEAAAKFLKDRTSGPEVFLLTWPTIMAYLRISTHPRVFARPLSPAEALANIEALLRLSRVSTLAEEEGLPDLYRTSQTASRFEATTFRMRTLRHFSGSMTSGHSILPTLTSGGLDSLTYGIPSSEFRESYAMTSRLRFPGFWSTGRYG